MPTDSLSPVLIALAVVGGYLLGSIPFGVIATRLGGAGDVRNIGSGNIGATNVLRTGRKDLALLTLLGDGGKWALAVFIAWLLTRQAGSAAQAQLTALAGGASFLGHLFPVWLKFKGGKGVATLLGLSVALAWPIGLVFALVWLGTVLLLRISSLGGMLGAVAAPIAACRAAFLGGLRTHRWWCCLARRPQVPAARTQRRPAHSHRAAQPFCTG